jgi:hypothetical protein
MQLKEAIARIKEILRRSPDSHNVYTPLELCDEMLSKIPELNSEIDILVMFNLEFLWALKEKIGSLKNVWFLTPDELKERAAKGMGVKENKVIRYEYNSSKKIEENMPKFDVVVGNPPYKKNLHLKFLELTVNCLNENGKIVWVHPARWLQDPTAPFKKNSDFNKYKHLSFIDFKIIPMINAQKIFKAAITSDLIISSLELGKTSIINEEKIYELRNIPVSLKTLIYSIRKNFISSIEQNCERNKRDGIRVIIPAITKTADRVSRKNVYGIINTQNYKKEIIVDGCANGIDWTQIKRKNQFTKEIGSNIPLSIKFNTIDEAKNFIDSTFTEVFQFFNYLTKLDVHVQLKYLPFMEDYTQPWTNERFQKYFSISDEELKFIKETMKKYI